MKKTIQRNLSDAEMFAGHQETITFENDIPEDTATRQVRPAPQKAQTDFHAAFFTAELQEKVGKALLEVKMQLFKEGVVDFDIKVARDGSKVVLTAVPAKPPKERATGGRSYKPD